MSHSAPSFQTLSIQQRNEAFLTIFRSIPGVNSGRTIPEDELKSQFHIITICCGMDIGDTIAYANDCCGYPWKAGDQTTKKGKYWVYRLMRSALEMAHLGFIAAANADGVYVIKPLDGSTPTSRVADVQIILQAEVFDEWTPEVQAQFEQAIMDAKDMDIEKF